MCITYIGVSARRQRNTTPLPTIHILRAAWPGYCYTHRAILLHSKRITARESGFVSLVHFAFLHPLGSALAVYLAGAPAVSAAIFRGGCVCRRAPSSRGDADTPLDAVSQTVCGCFSLRFRTHCSGLDTPVARRRTAAGFWLLRFGAAAASHPHPHCSADVTP